MDSSIGMLYFSANFHFYVSINHICLSGSLFEKGKQKRFCDWLVGRNMSKQVREAWSGKSTERDYCKWGSISGSGKNVAQVNLPGIYKDDDN